MVNLIERRIFGERFILVEGNYRYRDVFAHIQANFGKPAPSIRIGRTLLWTGQKALSVLSFLTGKDPEVTPAMVYSLLNQQLYSNEKLLKTLDPALTPVKDAITAICAAYLSEAAPNAGTPN
jgi:dihydroflavonol-4-reductase